MFEVRGLSFSYRVGRVGERKVEVLRDLNFSVAPGEFVAIQGPSGSGKSTLFYILGFLLKPTDGEVRFDGIDIGQLSTDELTVLRNKQIGFVFQQFHLLARANVIDNILLPASYPSEMAQPGPSEIEHARQLARRVGLEEHLHHLPNQLSGGQQQRVAIARALINDVDLILADEPTGNLDSRSAAQILELLGELNRAGKTIILITHDSEVARRCSKVYHLKDGAFTHIVENFPPPSPDPEKSAPTDATLRWTYSLPMYGKITRSVFPLVTENLLRNKAKSLLTMLGVVIGVAAVLSTVTLGQFAKKKILETYEVLGVNKVVMRGYPNWNRKASDAVRVNFNSFDWDKDLLPLRRIFPSIVGLSPSLVNNWGIRATAGGIEIDDRVSAMGISPEYLSITNRRVELGRSLTPYHVENRSPVCVVGHEIAQRLFKRINPLGQVITITDGQRINFPCEVIGVLASVTSNQNGAPPNLHVFVPYTYFQTVVSWWYSLIHEAVLKVSPTADVEATGKAIKAFFEVRYGKSGMFSVDSDSTLVAQMKKFLNIFAVLLTSIALLSLLVGGIGINNMMLVSVAERLKEFGIRKALGATHRSIRVQVLLESVTLCVLAGIMGVALGFCAYELLIFGATKFVPNLAFEWVFDPWAAALSVLAIATVGIASGFVPALRAEKLEVIEALRSE